MSRPTVKATMLERPLEPLWRGLIVYRVLTLTISVVTVLATLQTYPNPPGAIAVLVAMTAWTGVLTFGYRPVGTDRPDRRQALAVVDLVVSVASMATTPFLVTSEQLAAQAPVMGSVWTSGAVLAVALAYGPVGGFAAAAAISAMLVLVKPEFGRVELSDIQLLVLAGLTVGYAGMVVRRTGEQLRRAHAAQGAAAERERLARSIHDGVLQVLSHVRRRGGELGGGAGELGVLAGEQEIALRGLITRAQSTDDEKGQRDLLAAVATMASPRVTVSLPATPVELPAATVESVVAVIGAALSNVDEHVGRDAPAWLLVEDLGDTVVVSVRDNGPGIPPGRLEAAVAEGRMGVNRSMHGRVADLGGTISCETGPGLGTEWTIQVPREVVKGRRR